jgi:hypothetical protein
VRIVILKALSAPMTMACNGDCVKAAGRSRRRIGVGATAPPAARSREHEPLDDQNQNSDACGGALAPSEAVGATSSPRSRRCARIRSINSGSSMFAITFKRPPQRAHCSISIPNTRLRRRAQFMRAP